MLGYVQLKREKYAEAAAAFEQSLASGLLPATETHDRLKLVTQLHLQLKNYPKAIEFGNKLLASSSDPQPEIQALVAQAKYLSGDYRGSIDGMTQAIEMARKTGKAPDENWLQVQLSGYVQLKDAAGVLAVLKQLAVAYPKKNYLTDLFGQWKREQNDDRLVLNLYRVMFHLNLLEFSEDYLKMAQLANELGFPGEAITVLEKGNADKKFADEVEQVQYKKQLASAKTLAVTDRRTIETLEKSVSGKGGEDYAQLGVALASYEQYDKAVQALQTGIQKGGVKRLDQAQIILGYALLKLNRLQESQAAFASVDSSSQLGTVAQLWKAYTVQPSPLG
jgi:tetratricopeptide (TPR) repeat protein